MSCKGQRCTQDTLKHSLGPQMGGERSCEERARAAREFKLTLNLR